MNEKRLSRFACPKCKGPLQININKKGKSVEEGFLTCSQCDGRAYEIHRGIPRFVKRPDKSTAHTSKSFGFKWTKFSHIDASYKKNFLDELNPLDYKTFFKGKTVLDAGIGMGIPSHCMAEHGAKEVYGIDIADSIEIAHKNNKRFENVTIAQADIYHIPFPPESFDAVVCVAVLQHLPSPQKAFKILLDYVKPGGTLVIWVYGKEGNAFVEYVVEPLRKLVTRRLSIRITLAASYLLGTLFHFTANGIYKPLNRLNIKWLPMNNYIQYRTNFDLKMNVQMVFDQLLAPLSYLFHKEEVKQMFAHPKIRSYTLRHHNNNSWTAIGIKDTGA